MKWNLILLPRSVKKGIAMGVDLSLLAFCWWLTFAIKENAWFPQTLFSSFNIILFNWLVFIPAFIVLGFYREVVRYIEWRAHLTIVKGVLFGTLLLSFLNYFTGKLPPTFWILQGFFILFFISASRLGMIGWYRHALGHGHKKTRVAIYGAGATGAQLLQALKISPHLEPIIFLDDNTELISNTLGGIPIYNPQELKSLITQYHLHRIILAMPSLSYRRRKEIVHRLEPFAIHVMAVPNLVDLASGRVSIENIREIDISDLLGRDIVPPHLKLLTASVQDKTVLVTGAGGSIGGELCRQIILLNPKKLILYERSEYALYTLEQELKNLHPNTQTELVPVLGCVQNTANLEKILAYHSVHSLYHAAAYKHVHIIEKHPREGVQNNIFGTFSAIQAAIQTHVEHFVFISTDKAVRPTNVMGATKRFSELMLQAITPKNTRLCAVRFGNVLGSSGSVVPLFRQQIKKGGPITVTHPKVIRYFMMTQEAAQLVLQAGSLSQGGDVFVLNMGEPISIYDLAKRMVRLSGFTVKDDTDPQGDIEIQFTGLRAGEKLFEELLIEKTATPTEHPMIFREHPPGRTWPQIEYFLTQLQIACAHDNPEKLKEILSEAVLDYSPYRPSKSPIYYV